MASQDIFDQIPDIQAQQPVMPPMSNRRKAMARKQQQDPFAAIEIPQGVQAQMGRKYKQSAAASTSAPAQTPTPAPAPTRSSKPMAAPKIRIGGKHAPAEPEYEELKTPGPGIIQKVRDFFADRNARQIYKAAIAWLSEHEFWFIPVTVILIVVGLLMSRYISFVGAIVLLAIGWLVNRDNDVEDSFVFYLCALVCFIVPYLF
jgi:hypothetical protein